MTIDARLTLQAELKKNWGVSIEPRGTSFDIATISDWEYGNCANPVILHLPMEQTASLIQLHGIHWLARVISEELGTDSDTQLQEIIIRSDSGESPTLEAKRI